MKSGRVVVVENPDETELGCPLDVCEGPYSGDAPSPDLRLQAFFRGSVLPVRIKA